MLRNSGGESQLWRATITHDAIDYIHTTGDCKIIQHIQFNLIQANMREDISMCVYNGSYSSLLFQLIAYCQVPCDSWQSDGTFGRIIW